ncbi:MAG: L-histidine N(alpha)-methyltransferase [Bryobacteraceae bacterium]
MNVEILLTESEIAEEFADSLEARDLPEKFFYWSPLSAKAWQALARSPLYAGLSETWRRLASQTKLMNDSDKNLSLVSLGAGDGTRDRPILDALLGAGAQLEYFPVDASQILIEEACALAEDLEVTTRGLKADISSPVHLVLAADAAPSNKLFLMAGNTLAGFEPLGEIKAIANAMHPGDRLALDIEIHSEEAVSNHTGSHFRRLSLTPLLSVGVSPEQGDLRSEHRHDERREGLHLITHKFRVEEDIRIRGTSKEILLPRAEWIQLNFQYLCSREAVHWLLESHAGLKIEREVASEDGRFLALVCRKG